MHFVLGILQGELPNRDDQRANPSSQIEKFVSSAAAENDALTEDTVSTDLECPLNWSQKQKLVVLWSTAIFAAFATAFGPMVGTSYGQISLEFARKSDDVVQIMSGNFSVALGVGTLLTSAFGVVYGKRPAFLISALLLTILSLWMALERRYTGLEIARILQGLCSAPIEVLSTGLVADLFVVEHRGRGLAIIGALHFLSVLLSQVLAGFAVQHMGWRSLFLVMSLVMALVWPLVLLLIPETSWKNTRDLDVLVHEKTTDQPIEIRRIPQRRLKLWNGRISNTSYWSTCFRPLPLICYPAVIFGAFVHGLGSTYLYAFAFAKLRLFSAAPYYLTTSQIGMTVLPGAASGLAAQYLAGTLSDYLVKQLAKRNQGQHEPEYRLILMVPQCIFSAAGFAGFGISIAHGWPLWQVLCFYACVTFSVPFGGLASLGYLVDAMPERNQEGLVSTMLIKSIFLLIFAAKINGWLEFYGVQNVFVTLGLFNLCISLCTIPFYMFGKVLRRRVAESTILRKLDRIFD